VRDRGLRSGLGFLAIRCGAVANRVGSYRGVRRRRQASEQWRTSCQTFSHRLRQLKGRPQVAHVLLSRWDGGLPRGISEVCRFDPVAAGALGPVERFIGSLQHPLRVAVLARVNGGDADAQGELAVSAIEAATNCLGAIHR